MELTLAEAIMLSFVFLCDSGLCWCQSCSHFTVTGTHFISFFVFARQNLYGDIQECRPVVLGATFRPFHSFSTKSRLFFSFRGLSRTPCSFGPDEDLGDVLLPTAIFFTIRTSSSVISPGLQICICRPLWVF